MAESPPSTLETSQANFKHLVWDIGWFGLGLPSTMSFLAVYAIRVDASATVLGLLTALPAIMALLSSQYARRWRRRYPDSVRAIFWPGLGQRLGFLLPALTPFFPAVWQPVWLVLAVSIAALPQGISSVMFLVLMRESVEVKRITALTSRRSMWFNLAVAAGTLAFGVWLDRAPFPLNYQVMFLAAFILTLISWWHVQQLQPVHVEPPPRLDAPPISPWRVGAFRRVVFLLMITHIPLFLIAPVVSLRMVGELGANESFMGYFALSGQLIAALMAGLTYHIINKIGSQMAMSLGMIGVGVAALIIAFTPTLWPTLIAGALGGASWTVTAIAIFGYFNDNMPQESITRYSTLWNQLVMLAVFIGPMVGSQMVNAGLSLTTALLIGAGLRLLAGLLIPLELLGESRRARRLALRRAGAR